MCGIAGIVSFDPRDRVDVVRLTAMRDVMRHRGPDGEGLFVDGPIGLAHRRLSIVDVAAGHQPMSNEDGSIWITFNGEIYTTWDSQSVGSGTVGHNVHGFLHNPESPRRFGLCVTGFEVGHPVRVAEFLSIPDMKAHVVATEGKVLAGAL